MTEVMEVIDMLENSVAADEDFFGFEDKEWEEGQVEYEGGIRTLTGGTYAQLVPMGWWVFGTKTS